MAEGMRLARLDWALILGYGIVAFAVGIYFSRRASKSISEFFIAGGSLPWWLAGTSMVATTFAADTPLMISGFIRQGGIYMNWLWWNLLFGGMMMVFFYARLWRRANIITDMEFTELRYSGKPAAFLRGFGACFGGIFNNCIVMAWVMLAMAKLTEVMLGWDKWVSIVVLVVLALAYTTLSGFWGVVATDLIQFVVAMVGSIALAVIVLVRCGGPGGMVSLIQQDPLYDPEVFRFVPSIQAGRLAVTTFVLQVGFLWWGAGQGGGYIAQRLFSARDERHSVLSAVWFNFAHYVLRPWPWIIVGLASIVFFPLATLPDAEMAYPMMIRDFMPAGLRGLMVASMLAAFMSTVDTQLNFGASYVINDLYKRFMVQDASERHYVWAARACMLIIVGLASLAAWQADTIRGLWIFLMKLGAGGGLLGMLRWYWWRPNAWAEVSALASSVLIANGNAIIRLINWVAGRLTGLQLPAGFMEWLGWFYSDDVYALNMLFIIVVCTIIWVSVTYLTAPVSEERLMEFYRRVRPGGWWGPIAAKCPEVRADRARQGWLGWILGVVCILGGLFGVGYLCLGRYGLGFVYTLAGCGAGWFMMREVEKGHTRMA